MQLKNRSGILFLVSAAVMLFTLSAAAQTQITTGVIQGTVFDATGAVVPGAALTIRNLDTNLERSAETSTDGRFVFLQLPPGPYELRVSKQGFSTIVQENLTLTVGQTIPLTLTMTVSPVAEEVVVTATPTIDTVKTESSSTLNVLSVENTPVLGRKFEDLFTLTPGVSIVQGPDGDEINFAGQRGIFNNISLDGGDYNNSFFGEQVGGQRAQIDITLDAVKEFQVIATGASAEFGRTAGGVVNVITKSGTNEVHGSLFYFQRHEELSANDSQGNPLTDFSREQFGGTIGGPFIQDKMFFFGAIEAITAELTRPGMSIQLGDTACPQSSFDISNPADEALLLDNPTTGQPVNADCQRLALLEWFQTNLGQDDGNPVQRPIRNVSFLGKYDWNMTPGNQVSFSYSYDRSKNTNETFDVATYGNSANGIEGASKIQTANVNLFSTISPTLFNEGHFTYSRESRPRAAIESNVPADIGIGGGTSGSDVAFRFGQPFFLQPTVDELFWKTQVRDNVSIITGKHTIKLGGEWIHSFNDQIFRGFFTGRYIFDSVAGYLRYVAAPALGAGFGPTVAACADGVTFTSSTAPTCTLASNPFTFGPGPLVLYLQGADRDGVASDAAGASRIDNEEFTFFIQDKWQIRPNFTLSFGLRYEAQLMPDTVDPTTTAYAQFLGDSTPNVLGIGFPSNGTIPDQKDMVQPRIGLAWDLFNNGKSVLRASWGIYNARQNMLTQVGSVTTNGLQQQTLFTNTAIIGFGAPAPIPPGVLTPAPVPPGTFPLFSGVRVFSRDYENPRIYTGNIAFEQEIYPDWAAYLDFTLAEGTRLTRFININRADRGSPFAPALDETMVAASIGQSTYRGVTVGMRKKFSQGFQLEWNYTWSKDEDDDSNERDPFTDRSNTLDPFDLSLNFGNSDRDIRHKFNFFTYAELPAGFQINARIQARSAQPITDENRASIFASTGGDIGRNTVRKNNEFFSLDWRLTRPFRWGERYAITPIFEMFNSFDNDNNINPLISPALFNFDGFLRTGVGDPLQVQLAVKFTF
ncbi:MAG: carboxypeptidase regulatory-like domain-containing protein [Terriglobia bacterium]